MTSLSQKLRNRLRRLLVAAANATILPLSKLAPRRRDCWAFGHQLDRFGGNAKYLFLWMSRNRPDLQPVWITGSEKTRRLLARHGLAVHRRWSPGGVLAALRSKVFVYGHGLVDVNLQLSGGVLRLNLWHGIGLKPLRTGAVFRKYRGRRIAGLQFLDLLAPSDVVVTTSDFTQAHFAGQFEIPADRCPQLGYPRLDPLSDEDLRQAAEAIDKAEGFEFNAKGFSEVHVYMPTFRDSGRSFVDDALPDMARLSAALARRNALLYVKLHPRTAEELPELPANVRLWPDEIDFYTHMPKVDVLITDYSSIFYDFIFNRSGGVILYIFDYQDYQDRDRGLIYPFEENVAGVRARSFEALCEVIESGAALEPAPQVEAVREKFWGGSPRRASPAIVAYVEEALGVGGEFGRTA